MQDHVIQKTVKDLAEALGPERLSTDPDVLEAYSRDETSDLSHRPDILVRALTAGDVSLVMKVCSRNAVPVVPRGAGTGVTGGAVPVKGGVVLSLERMNRILEIDRENMIAVVEPGVITGELQRAVLAEGLLYPPDPASLDMCSIGGNVAEIAGGPRAVKYGTTRDYVLGLEIVLPDGSLFSTGGKFVKNATGYNLTGIILGSEGTLAVITKIILRLVPAPRCSIDLLLPFDSLPEAMRVVYEILISRIVPATIEFMEEDGLRLVARFLGAQMPFPEARAHLLVQLDAQSEEALNRELVAVSALAPDPARVIAAQSPEQRERLWKARRSIREAIHAESPVFLAEDCVVPRSRIPEFLAGLKEYFATLNLRSVMFGHAGDGNVHVDLLKDAMDYGAWKEMLPSVKKEIYRRAISLGGTITGEHGVGFIRREYLPLALSQAELGLLRRIKQAFDPQGILNPDKII